MKLHPLRQTPEVINPTNFQLDPPMGLAPWRVEVGGSPIDFPNDSYECAARDYDILFQWRPPRFQKQDTKWRR